MSRIGKYLNSVHGLKILVIGDTHFRPGEPFDEFGRARAIGKMILDERPDVIVQIGDLCDFESMNGWAGAKSVGGGGSNRSHQNKRIIDDLACFRTAQRDLKRPTDLYNERAARSRHKERLYEPRWVQLLGNHCDRLDRVAETIPELHGMIGTHLLHDISRENGWECHPFNRIVEIAGIDFSHYFETGNSKRPAQIKQVLGKRHASSIFGHSHIFGFDQQAVGNRGTIGAVCVGCFKPPRRCGPFEWSGVVMLTDCEEGNFNLSQIPYDVILEAYGEGDYSDQLRGLRARDARERDDARRAFA